MDGQQAQHLGLQESATEPLDQAHADDDRHRPRERAADGPHAEEHQAGHEDTLSAPGVAEAPADDQEAGRDHRIARDDQLQFPR